MTDKYNLEKAILNDVIRSWNENMMDSCDKSECNCKDNLLLIRCILSNDSSINTQIWPRGTLNIEYKNKKIKEMFLTIMANEKRIMPCGHQWYSYNCQEYLKNIKEIVLYFP